MLAIALPAALALAADPIASLVDTAFVGHIGINLLRGLLSYVNTYLDCAKGTFLISYYIYILIWSVELEEKVRS